MKIKRLTDAAVLEASVPRPKPLSPLAKERAEQASAFRGLIEQLDENAAFQVDLESTDRAATIRQRLLRVAEGMGVEIAVRKHGKGFAVGLMTPSRRSRRGRPRLHQDQNGH